MPLSDENTLQALRILERNPELSQRELAKELGVSLATKPGSCNTLKLSIHKRIAVRYNFR